MEIIRAAHMGFCFGVRDAVALALREAAAGPLTVLGELVHNPAVIARLRAAGAATGDAGAFSPVVMITAHGASDKRRADLAEAGRRVVDGTCPLVRAAHAALKSLAARGYHPVVIGRKGHVEVLGLTGDWPEAFVLEDEADLAALPFRPRFGVVSQTTQPLARVKALVDALRKRFPAAEVRFTDTVCQPTKDRQTAAAALAKAVDTVVVVGGRRSNNSRELVETCGRFCRRVHLVEAAADLRSAWFAPGDKVGLTAGTSTPDDVIDAVEVALKNIARAGAL